MAGYSIDKLFLEARESNRRRNTNFDAIIEKYSKKFENDDDIHLHSGTICRDQGWVRSKNRIVGASRLATTKRKEDQLRTGYSSRDETYYNSHMSFSDPLNASEIDPKIWKDLVESFVHDPGDEPSDAETISSTTSTCSQITDDELEESFADDEEEGLSPAKIDPRPFFGEESSIKTDWYSLKKSTDYLPPHSSIAEISQSSLHHPAGINHVPLPTTACKRIHPSPVPVFSVDTNISMIDNVSFYPVHAFVHPSKTLQKPSTTTGKDIDTVRQQAFIPHLLQDASNNDKTIYPSLGDVSVYNGEGTSQRCPPRSLLTKCPSYIEYLQPHQTSNTSRRQYRPQNTPLRTQYSQQSTPPRTQYSQQSTTPRTQYPQQSTKQTDLRMGKTILSRLQNCAENHTDVSANDLLSSNVTSSSSNLSTSHGTREPCNNVRHLNSKEQPSKKNGVDVEPSPHQISRRRLRAKKVFGNKPKILSNEELWHIFKAKDFDDVKDMVLPSRIKTDMDDDTDTTVLNPNIDESVLLPSQLSPLEELFNQRKEQRLKKSVGKSKQPLTPKQNLINSNSIEVGNSPITPSSSLIGRTFLVSNDVQCNKYPLRQTRSVMPKNEMQFSPTTSLASLHLKGFSPSLHSTLQIQEHTLSSNTKSISNDLTPTRRVRNIVTQRSMESTDSAIELSKSSYSETISSRNYQSHVFNSAPPLVSEYSTPTGVLNTQLGSPNKEFDLMPSPTRRRTAGRPRSKQDAIGPVSKTNERSKIQALSFNRENQKQNLVTGLLEYEQMFQKLFPNGPSNIASSIDAINKAEGGVQRHSPIYTSKKTSQVQGQASGGLLPEQNQSSSTVANASTVSSTKMSKTKDLSDANTRKQYHTNTLFRQIMAVKNDRRNSETLSTAESDSSETKRGSYSNTDTVNLLPINSINSFPNGDPAMYTTIISPKRRCGRQPESDDQHRQNNSCSPSKERRVDSRPPENLKTNCEQDVFIIPQGHNIIKPPVNKDKRPTSGRKGKSKSMEVSDNNMTVRSSVYDWMSDSNSGSQSQFSANQNDSSSPAMRNFRASSPVKRPVFSSRRAPNLMNSSFSTIFSNTNS